MAMDTVLPFPEPDERCWREIKKGILPRLLKSGVPVDPHMVDAVCEFVRKRLAIYVWPPGIAYPTPNETMAEASAIFNHHRYNYVMALIGLGLELYLATGGNLPLEPEMGAVKSDRQTAARLRLISGGKDANDQAGHGAPENSS